MAERAGESERERKEGDDRWDRAVSERTRGRGWAALLGRAGAGASARAGHAAGPSRRKEGYNIPDVKEQLKCDNGASSSINIK
jgi:hypothetical protein